jgi:hypothetical protein
MDVINPCMDAPAMVNEDPRAEKPCSACGPTVMLTVYGPTNGFQEYQKEVGSCCKYLNPQHASNPCSHGANLALIPLIQILRDEI